LQIKTALSFLLRGGKLGGGESQALTVVERAVFICKKRRKKHESRIAVGVRGSKENWREG
jgi:hypothetical protein